MEGASGQVMTNLLKPRHPHCTIASLHHYKAGNVKRKLKFCTRGTGSGRHRAGCRLSPAPHFCPGGRRPGPSPDALLILRVSGFSSGGGDRPRQAGKKTPGVDPKQTPQIDIGVKLICQAFGPWRVQIFICANVWGGEPRPKNVVSVVSVVVVSVVTLLRVPSAVKRRTRKMQLNCRDITMTFSIRAPLCVYMYVCVYVYARL